MADRRAIARAAPVLDMPLATDLYLPVEDARYECGFIRTCLL